MNDFKVTVDNVRECWELYEQYIEEQKQLHYSDTSYDEFVEWCESELMECPNCGAIVSKDEQECLLEDWNTDGVCDDCIMECGYYE